MSEQEDPRELARRLAEQAKARAQGRPAAPSLAERASLVGRAPRPMTAQEALQAAREQERLAQERREEQARKVAEARALAEARKVAEARKAADVLAAAKPPPPAEATAPPAGPLQDPAELIPRRLPGAEVLSTRVVGARDAFRALWTAHRVRAAAEDDVGLLVTADVLLNAAIRLPAGALVAAHVRRGEAEHAVFVDASAGVLLGITPTPALFLAGI